MQQVFEHLEEDSSGPTMTRGQLELTARLAAAVDLDSEGRLVKMPLVAKDITRESFSGGALTSYRGTHAGHGPRYESWLRQRAFETKLHAMSTFEEGAARLSGPFTDLWCIILVHKDWVIIIGIVLLSRYLLLFRKHNVPLPLFLVHSSKVTNIFISGLKKRCWRPDLSKHDFEAFMNDPTLDTFRAVLPGNLPSFRTDDLNHLASEPGMEKWEKLRLANFSKYAGGLAIVHISPFDEDQSLILMSSHTGVAKYVTQVFRLLQAADELVYLKFVIPEALAKRSSNRNGFYRVSPRGCYEHRQS